MPFIQLIVWGACKSVPIPQLKLAWHFSKRHLGVLGVQHSTQARFCDPGVLHQGSSSSVEFALRGMFFFSRRLLLVLLLARQTPARKMHRRGACRTPGRRGTQHVTPPGGSGLGVVAVCLKRAIWQPQHAKPRWLRGLRPRTPNPDFAAPSLTATHAET